MLIGYPGKSQAEVDIEEFAMLLHRQKAELALRESTGYGPTVSESEGARWLEIDRSLVARTEERLAEMIEIHERIESLSA